MTADKVTTDGRTRLLEDGVEMPMLGLGVWQVPNGPECVNAVRWALELGYRHIDTAEMYGTYVSVKKTLTTDDIQGIQSIYSNGAARSPARTRAPTAGSRATARVLTESRAVTSQRRPP